MLLWGRKKNNSSLQYQFDYQRQLQSCFGGCLHADDDNNYVKSCANQSHIIDLITHYLHAHGREVTLHLLFFNAIYVAYNQNWLCLSCTCQIIYPGIFF